MKQPTVLLVHSDEIGAADVKDVLESLACVRILGATSRCQALASASAHPPDGIVTGATLGGKPILPLLAELSGLCPESRIVVFTLHDEPDAILPFAGLIDGYLPLSELTCTTLAHCLAAVLFGHVKLAGDRLAEAVVGRLQGRTDPCIAGFSALSTRERQVYDLVVTGRSNMERYLVFDAGCSTCSKLAEAVQEAAAGKLKATSIHEEEGKTLLDRAYPKGWKNAPYLLAVDGGRVSASTGFAAAARLDLLIGPRKTCRVWSLANHSGVPLPPGSAAAAAYGASRRRFLKAGVTVAAALGLLGLTGSAPAIGVPECPCGCFGSNESCSDYQVACCDGCDAGTFWHCVDCCGEDCGYTCVLVSGYYCC